MTATAGAPLTGVINWKSIIWTTVEDHVNRLQLRIAKAIKIGRYGKAKALQWLLTHSFYAKLLAINIRFAMEYAKIKALKQEPSLNPKQVLNKNRRKDLVLFL